MVKIMGIVEFNGVKLYYEIHGQGDALVMIQGRGGDITLREPQIEPLSKHFQLILFDNRDMGRSQVTPGDYTIQMLAQDTASLIEQLGIKKAHILRLVDGQHDRSRIGDRSSRFGK
jgi:pimeloyl-ACP methyl ester carboxylesterase